MKTQLSILVKNESFLARGFVIGFWWTKSVVNVYIDSMDSAPIPLKASKKPHLIDITPGQHAVAFVDSKAKNKALGKKIMGAFFGSVITGGSGGSMLSGAAMGAGMVGDSVNENVVNFNLKEGDVLKLQVQNKTSGKVKVKLLK